MALRIARYKGKPFNEQNTKASIIEPVLAALGWDTHDPEQVNREFKTNAKDNPVDYALMLMRQPRLVIEAKGLNETMDDVKWMNQTISYAAIGGALWCVLTNGDEYRIYNATAPVAAADKMLCRVCLSTDPTPDVADILSLISHANMGENYINVLWQTQHIDRRVRAALEEMFAEQDRRLAVAVRTRIGDLSVKDIVGSLRRLSARFEQPQIRLPQKKSRNAAVATPADQPTSKAMAKAKKARSPKSPSAKVELAQLISVGLLAPNARLFRTYRKKLVEATLLPDGQVAFGDKTFPSCSAAAGQARGTVTGRPMATNGWAFWQVEGGDGKPRTLEEVRANFAKSS